MASENVLLMVIWLTEIASKATRVYIIPNEQVFIVLAYGVERPLEVCSCILLHFFRNNSDIERSLYRLQLDV